MTDTVSSSYERMTVVELRALATARGLNFNTKTRKPDLITLHQEHDVEQNARVQDEYITDDWDSNPPTSKTLKLDPLQMRWNYARQNARDPHLTFEQSWSAKLTQRQLRAINKRMHLISVLNLMESDIKKIKT